MSTGEKVLRRLIEFDRVMTCVLGEFATCAHQDIDTCVVQGLQSIAQFIGADHAYVIMLSHDATSWSATHEWCAPHVAPVIQEYQRVPMGAIPWSENRLLSGETVRVSSPHDYPPEAADTRRMHEQEGAVSVLELPIRYAMGQIAGCIGVHSHSRPVSWTDDDVHRMRMIGDTIAGLIERKRLETAFRDREERIRLSLDGSDVGTWDWDIPSGDVVYFRHWAEMLEYEAEEVGNPALDWERLLHPDDRDRVKSAIEEHLAGKTSLFEVEERLLSKSNEWRWLLFRGRVIQRDEEGRPLRAVGVHVDVTRQKEAELALLESRSQILSIFNSTEDFIISVDPYEYGLLTWNESIRRYFAEERGIELRVGMTPVQLLPPEFASIWCEFYLRALAEGAFTAEYEVVAGTRTLLLSFSPLKRGEEVFGISVFGKDITRRKQAEEELQKRLLEINELKVRLEAESTYLQEEIKLEHNFENIIGRSDALKYVLYRVQQVGSTDMTALILGETGTGKELIARAIHETSSRRTRPMVKVNCAALPLTLIESELFGHEKGAFTGAGARKLGRFELANNTTLFLDEVGELPLDLQAKLLRVLEEGEFERVGGTLTIKINVRVIAATNRDLEKEMKEGRFRPDLWYRLNVYPITVPALRERIDDIPLLVTHFVEQCCKQFGRNIRSIPTRVIEDLQNYDWPGNIRELKHVIERAVISSSGGKLQIVDNLSALPAPPALSGNGERTLEEMERDYIVQILEKTGWKVEGKLGAAEILDINPGTLRSRMKKLGIRRGYMHHL